LFCFLALYSSKDQCLDCLPVISLFFFLRVCHLNSDKNKNCKRKRCRYIVPSPACAASLHGSGCTEASVTRRRVLFNAIVIIYGVCLQFDSETARWLTALRPPSNRNCAYGDPGIKPERNKNRKSKIRRFCLSSATVADRCTWALWHCFLCGELSLTVELNL